MTHVVFLAARAGAGNLPHLSRQLRRRFYTGFQDYKISKYEKGKHLTAQMVPLYLFSFEILGS
jgi:hypothetical protein